MLSQSQITHFCEQGYLHVPGVVRADELEGLRAATRELVEGLAHRSAETNEDIKTGALVGEHIGEGNHLCRIEYTFHKDRRFLMLLGNPRLLEIAASLADGPLVVTWEDMIVKMPGCGLAVPFHQDALHQCERSTVFSVGLYLDDSDDDPLLAIPGTQRLGPLGEDRVREVARERAADVVALPVRAGDALVHDVRMIHGSAANAGEAPRRVIYLEFRSPQQLCEDSPWDVWWLARRARYIPAAVAIRARERLGEPDAVDLGTALAGRAAPLVPHEAAAASGEPLDLRVHHQEFGGRQS